MSGYYAYQYRYGYYDYGYGYGYEPSARYGYSSSYTNPSTGYTHTHSICADASGSYYHMLDENRGPAFDRSYQVTQTYNAGIYADDILSTSTPLDGAYHSYGSRYISTYNINDHTVTTNSVNFAQGFSYSHFTSYDYATGASVSSFDIRYFGAYGYYESTSSAYTGPGGYNYSSGGGYHYTA